MVVVTLLLTAPLAQQTLAVAVVAQLAPLALVPQAAPASSS
jgi:hypothetical protein